jgi:ABC-type transporter Mla maintaining outer membrane lipid asymmetry permease subunit MlaE
MVATTFRVKFAAARHRFEGWLVEYGRRLRQLFVENPKALWHYLTRLGAALLRDPAQLPERLPRLRVIVAQTFRSFMRGWPVVVVFGIVIGFGLGAVADRFGQLLHPLLEQTVLLSVVRDGAPLILAVFLTARMGASIAARLADDRQTEAPPEGRFDSKQILALSVPHLVAGAVTGWLFYRIAVLFISAGFRSMGDLGAFWSELWGSDLISLDRALPLVQATFWGSLKAALYGFVVALAACALGIATSERRSFGRQRAIDVQNTVWESGVMALFICVALALLLQSLQPNFG